MAGRSAPGDPPHRKNPIRSVLGLLRKTGTSPEADYDRPQRVADEARVKSEQPRLALEQHDLRMAGSMNFDYVCGGKALR